MRLLLIFLMVLGCQEKKQPRIMPRTISEKPVPVEAWEPTEAQGRLATTTLTVGPVQVQAEQCRTEREIQTGMMFRKTMTDKEAMLFVHAGPAPRSYWMKNVTVPLSIGSVSYTHLTLPTICSV